MEYHFKRNQNPSKSRKNKILNYKTRFFSNAPSQLYFIAKKYFRIKTRFHMKKKKKKNVIKIQKGKIDFEIDTPFMLIQVKRV